MDKFLRNLGFNFKWNVLFSILLQNMANESKDFYVVTIDAGSTGSRVNSYKFRISKNTFDPSSVDLIDVLFEGTKPGLSDYADNPEKGAQVIVDLIKKVEHFTPAEKREETPILVRATSGLRLIPQKDAQALLKSVARAISGLGYHTDSNSVKILDSAYEGIYLWHSVQLLYKTSRLRINPALRRGESLATLDLGAGSTQITYQLSNGDLSRYPSSHRFSEVSYPGGKNVTLYSHSYLHLGKIEARRRIFKQEIKSSRTKVKSVCVHPVVQNESLIWMKEEIRVSGAKHHHLKPSKVFKRCHDHVKRFVLATLDWQPPDPPIGRIVAVASFFAIANEAGLIDDAGGVVTVSKYRKAAISACSVANKAQPWACLDLVYVVTLLQDAYKIPDDEPIWLLRTVDKFYVAGVVHWAGLHECLGQTGPRAVELTIKTRRS